MLNNFSRSASVVAMTASLVVAGCGIRESDTNVTSADNKDKVTQIIPTDENHIIVKVPNLDNLDYSSPQEFSAALTQFRKSHPGDFTIVPSDQRFPLSSREFMAIRRVVGENSISLPGIPTENGHTDR